MSAQVFGVLSLLVVCLAPAALIGAIDRWLSRA